MQRLGLADAIQSLRAELTQAITAGADETLRFEVGEIDVEFHVAVDVTAKSGVKFWVVELGGEAGRTSTHSVRIPLRPTRRDGGRVLTGSGQETPEPPPAP
jgi:hypothetical protein